jgi:Response regulators consisting of a CheY-like receiver domain and a winged-helix DNA-binding domain
MRLLLVEDERPLGNLIRQGLEQAGYKVEWATDGDQGALLATEGGFDLVILDVMLPGRDGWSICQSLRARRDPVPILMLTARDAVDDRVKGLELGADDYLTKPFDFKELRARVRALLRRGNVNRARVIRVGDLEIDTVSRRVSRGGSEISLTAREYALLETLAASEGRILDRETILARAWPDPDGSGSNTVDVYIWMLRKKIDADRSVKLIHTVHGRGYVLRDDHSSGGGGGSSGGNSGRAGAGGAEEQVS